jgi:hypothetical protein
VIIYSCGGDIEKIHKAQEKENKPMKKQITIKELKKIVSYSENTSNNDFANDICCLLIELKEALNELGKSKDYVDKCITYKREKIHEALDNVGFFDDIRK